MTFFGRFEALESIPAIGHFSTQSSRPHAKEAHPKVVLVAHKAYS